MFRDIAAIDARLKEIEQEKQELLALKSQWQQAKQGLENPTGYSTEDKIQLFRSLFRGRADIFAHRWQNQKGRSGYAVACDNEWAKGICQKPKIKCQNCNHRQFTSLTDQVIYRHLTGQQVIGVYPLLPDNSCYFLAADFDKGKWREEMQAMAKACLQLNVPHAIEISRSGNGAHLWVFFSDSVAAKDARSLGFGLLDKAMEIYPALSFESYDRLFPNQDILPEGGFGNLIALPLQREARRLGHSEFVDKNLHAISNQWQHLFNLERLSPERVSAILSELSPRNETSIGVEEEDSLPPWEITAKTTPLVMENSPEKVLVTLANQIYFSCDELPSALIARLRRLACFANPVFFKTQALRFSTHGIPRFISCARIERGYLAIPRGCLDEALELLRSQQILIEFDEKRRHGQSLVLENVAVKLRQSQQTAVAEMSKHDTGILHAPTAFGKTITAIGLIAHRRVNTLILVHSRQLVDQWRERLNSFLPGVDVGVIRGGKSRPSGVVDVATYQSLINRKDNSVLELVQDYGQIIVDECHHVSAPRFEMVLNEVRAKYVVGLTATPERQDGHQKIIFMALGPIRHRVKSSSQDQFEQEVVVRRLLDIPPDSILMGESRPKISDVYRWILENEGRTQQIVTDVLCCVGESRHPIVLTERREHAESIHALLLEKGVDSVVLKGGMRATERKRVIEVLPTVEVVVATGKYIGEGFDLPRLDTLFLAMPIAWKGSLSQYAGRIHRESDGKDKVLIYDYVDIAHPMLERMFQKRVKSYQAMGYQVRDHEVPKAR